MVTYGVTLYPAPGVTEQQMDALLARIAALAGALPGLSRVEIDPSSGAADQSRSYSMYFDTQAHMQAYTAHPSYQAIRGELHRLCPTSVATAIETRHSLGSD
jgi:hypothetical protein